MDCPAIDNPNIILNEVVHQLPSGPYNSYKHPVVLYNGMRSRNNLCKLLLKYSLLKLFVSLHALCERNLT